MQNNEENIANSTIKQLSKNAGFTVPEKYFENLQNVIIEDIKILNFKIENTKGGFIVNDDFFETQKQIILNKTIKNKPNYKINLYPNLFFKVTSIAALITIVGFLFLYKNNAVSYANTIPISHDEILQHLEKNEVSIELISEEINLNKTNISNKNNELEKYLIEQADEQQLIDEL